MTHNLSAEALINASPDAVVLCDTAGIISAWNENAVKLFGWSVAEALGRSVGELLVPPELRIQYNLTLKKLAAGTLPSQGQRTITVLAKDGTRRAVDFWWSTWRSGRIEPSSDDPHTQQSPDAIVGHFRDLTRRDYLETRLARLSLESRMLDEPSLYSTDEESFESALTRALETLCEVTGWPVGHALLPSDDDLLLESSPVWTATSIASDELEPLKQTRHYRRGEGVPGRVWETGRAEWKLLKPDGDNGVLTNSPSSERDPAAGTAEPAAASPAAEDRTPRHRTPDNSGPEALPDQSGDVTASLPSGIQATYCLPVKVRKKVIAVLEFYCGDSHPPHIGLETLIKKLSRTLGHIIERREWQEERQRMAAIVQSSYDAIISKDVNGIITSWNVGAEQLYGYPASEALGRSVSIILPPETDREETEVLDAVKEGHRLEQFETTRRRSTGEMINVSLTISPLRDATGRIVGTASIERDITRRKQAQFRLQEAIVAAEEANRTKSEFLANISHELRTPMNAILGMTRLSLQEPLPEIVRDYLTTARDSADTMLLLINDILDFSRLEANRFELDPAPFDVRQVLDETLLPLSLRAHEKGLELAARVRSNVPARFIGDSMRVRQVLTNLISNAIKFTESGEVAVTVDMLSDDNDFGAYSEDIETQEDMAEKLANARNNPGEVPAKSPWQPPVRRPETDNSLLPPNLRPATTRGVQDFTAPSAGSEVHLRFCVADTGIGIHPDDQERIFAPFTQVDASTTRSHPGTGLGLSICKDLARLMNGDVRVESALGQGSRFFFTARLPVAEGEVQPAQGVDTASLANTPVLIVDDNETNRHFLKEMLESWSMQPVIAPSAEAALRELEHATETGAAFPLLIVDAVMPNTDGLQLLEQIQDSTESSGATILMLSPADQKLFRERSEELNIGAVLPKPVSQSSLLNAICEVFGGSSVLHAPEQQIDITPQPLRILVAEDIAANRKVVEAILTKRGHTVTVAHNGRQAIEQYQRQSFDVILMDVQMPIMDGLQAVRAIRDSETPDHHVPIIAMTAHAMRGDREACLEAGMDAYIAKPLDSALLLQTLEHLADRTHSGNSDGLPPMRRTGTWQVRSSASETSSTSSSNSHPFDISSGSSPKAHGARQMPSQLSHVQPSFARPSDSEADPIWQPQVALKRMGEDQMLLASMIEYFLEDAPGLMQQLPAALREGADPEEATRLAHSLKGLCSSFEAAATVAVAGQIETACRERRLKDAIPLLPELHERIQELSAALTAWQSQHA